MSDLIQVIENSNCGDCSQSIKLKGCANNVPYLQIVNSTGISSATVTFINLIDGIISETAPVGYGTGDCHAYEEVDLVKTNWLPICVAGVQWYVLESSTYNNATLTETTPVKLYKQGAKGDIVTTAPLGATTEGYCTITNLLTTLNGLPRPIISLGGNFFLQHSRGNDINSLMQGSYTTSNDNPTQPSLTQIGDVWANDTLKVGISSEKGDYSFFYENKPMIFMELFSNLRIKNGSKTGDSTNAQWVHTQDSIGTLNRTKTNFSGGQLSAFKTEWDFITKDYDNTNIEINASLLQVKPQTLPVRKADWVLNSNNQFKKLRFRNIRTNGNFVITNWRQPVRFRFACVDPNDGRSIILGQPSDTLVISTKSGLFNDLDEYIYDWQIQFAN